MGTLKDISLFGSFSFPIDGEFSGGIVCRSLVGARKTLSKTKSQLQSLSGRSVPIAGATGATVKEDVSYEARTAGNQTDGQTREPYSVHFIQHAPVPLQPANKSPVAEYPYTERQPKAGFAIKKGGAKRVLFTMAQKEIMIEFYDRQATSGIRAKPEDVVEVMKQRGIEPLKENQIKNWWSTYHQKRKAALNSLTGQANSLAAGIPHIGAGQMISLTVPVQQSNSAPQGTTVPVTPSTCTSTVHVSSIPVPASTVTVQQTAPTTTGNTVRVTSVASAAPATLQTTASTVPVQQTAPTTSGNTVRVTPVASGAPSTLQTTASTVPVQQTAPTTSGNTVRVTPVASGAPSTLQTTASTVLVQQTAPMTSGNTVRVTPVASGAPSTLQTTASIVPVQQTAATTSGNTVRVTSVASGAPFTLQATVSPQVHASPLYGIPSSHTPCITEWNFPMNFSQSTLLGRLGSNACTFIALYFGNLYFLSCLKPPSDGVTLDREWQVSLREAILKGNEIHDDLYDTDAIDVAVDEAVELAGDECGVNCIENQYDIFGRNCNNQLSDIFSGLSLKQSCHVIVTQGKSFLLIVNTDQSTMIVDSHSHIGSGALISFAPPGHAVDLAVWFARMSRNTWNHELGTTSVISVSYVA